PGRAADGVPEVAEGGVVRAVRGVAWDQGEAVEGVAAGPQAEGEEVSSDSRAASAAFEAGQSINETRTT
ncbi:MAG: hypothetical protein WKF96_22980, partial [Solirubrobacteraceae bacterium]